MRLICTWRQRQLARFLVLEQRIPAHSRLGRHLARCPDCTRTQQEIASLRSDLTALPCPVLDRNFDARLMTRFRSELKTDLKSVPQFAPSFWTVRALRLSFGWALAGSALAAFTLWNLRPVDNGPKSAESVAVHNHITTAKTPLALALNKTSLVFDKGNMAKRVITPLTATPQPNFALRVPSAGAFGRKEGRRHLAGHIRRHHRRAFSLAERALYASIKRRQSNSPHGMLQAEVSDVPLLTCAARSWQALGDAYKTCGDYSRASQAYGQAFANQPDADYALAAGESAERAGDTGASLEYVALALDSAADAAHLKPSDTATDSDTKGSPK